MYQEENLEEFLKKLSSKKETPSGGGGSACALVGAIAVALSQMVVNLTIGKEKYENVQEEMMNVREELEILQKEFLLFMSRDSENLKHLLAVYKMPKDTNHQINLRKIAMEEALERACKIPLLIMEKCNVLITQILIVIEKGNNMAKSDTLEAVVLCEATLKSAKINVLVNTKLMSNRKLANMLNERANQLFSEKRNIIDEILQER